MVDVRWTCSFLHEKSPTCHKITSAGKLTVPRLNRSISHRSSFARVRQIPHSFLELSLSFAFRGVHKSPARSPDLVLITIRPTEISESLSFAAAVFALSPIDFPLIPKLTQLFKGSFLLSPFQCHRVKEPAPRQSWVISTPRPLPCWPCLLSSSASELVQDGLWLAPKISKPMII